MTITFEAYDTHEGHLQPFLQRAGIVLHFPWTARGGTWSCGENRFWFIWNDDFSFKYVLSFQWKLLSPRHSARAIALNLSVFMSASSPRCGSSEPPQVWYGFPFAISSLSPRKRGLLILSAHDSAFTPPYENPAATAFERRPTLKDGSNIANRTLTEISCRVSAVLFTQSIRMTVEWDANNLSMRGSRRYANEFGLERSFAWIDPCTQLPRPLLISSSW